MKDVDAMLGRRPETCLSDLVLDRLLAGELDGTPDADAVQTHLSACDVCTARLAELRAQGEAFGNEIWVAGVAAQTRKAARRGWARPAIAALAAAAAVVLVVQLVPHNANRAKGGDRLLLYARTGTTGQVSEVLPGEILAPDDAIRFSVSIKSDAFVVIVGIDAAGAVTPYVPVDGNDPVFLRRGPNQLIEGSIILDETLGPERVIAFACVNPVPVENIRAASAAALQEAGGDPRAIERVDVDCRQTSVLFEKQVRDTP